MNQIRAVLQAKSRIAMHQIASVRHESKLKVAVISFSATTMWFGALALFLLGFRQLKRLTFSAGPDFNITEVLMRQSLSILALSIFLFLVFSNVLVSFSTLYKSHEVKYLLQGPISYRDFFYARFVECVVFSSWSLAFLGTPLLLAYGFSSDASYVFYLAIVMYFLPFVIIPACLGSLITIFLVRIFPRLNARIMLGLGVAAVAGFFLYIRSVIRSTEIRDNTQFLQLFVDATSNTQSHFLPSYWTAQGVLAAADYKFGDSIYYFLLITANALFLLWLTAEIAHRVFYPGWAYLNGMDRERIRPEGKGLLNRFERLLRPIRNPERTLIMKDIRLFWRDPTQWSQFVIFFGIMAIYIANLRNSSREMEQEMWRSWIACLNVGAVTLILATLTSRFVFPLISLEGRRFWILGLAPLSMSQLIWQKFWLSVMICSVFTVGLTLLSGYMLQLAPIYFALTVYSVFITNLGLSGLAVGLGTLYPSFGEDNPARIVSGMGGTLNLLVSVGYITFVIAAQTFILQWRIIGRFTNPDYFTYALIAVVIFITTLSLVCMFLPMKLGLRHLEAREF